MPDRIPPEEARQGRRGRRVLVVLIVGLLLAGLAWWAVDIYGIVLDRSQPVETPASQDAPSE